MVSGVRYVDPGREMLSNILRIKVEESCDIDDNECETDTGDLYQGGQDD
jgi:hypothetical protein